MKTDCRRPGAEVVRLDDYRAARARGRRRALLRQRLAQVIRQVIEEAAVPKVARLG